MMQEDVRSWLGPSTKLIASETLWPARFPVHAVSEGANAVAKTAGWLVGVQPWLPPARAPALRAARMMAWENIFMDGLDVDESDG